MPCHVTPGVLHGSPHAERLESLANLQATDPGTFVLAVHSFFEGVMRERLVLEENDDDRFFKLLERYALYCQKKLGFPQKKLSVLDLINSAHTPTKDVRHHFAAVNVNRARKATVHLERFCQISGIHCPQEIASLKRYNLVWDGRKSVGARDRGREERSLGFAVKDAAARTGGEAEARANREAFRLADHGWEGGADSRVPCKDSWASLYSESEKPGSCAA